MTTTEVILNEGALKIEKIRSAGELMLVLSGKSIMRDASQVLLPVFIDGFEEAKNGGVRLVLDFRSITYMNSSSFAPVIKILEKARLGTVPVSVIYSSNQKWQEVSFAAMTIFKTPDGRVAITGMQDEPVN